MKLHIVLADDHAIVSSGIRMFLESNKALRVVEEVASTDDLLKSLDKHHCDVVITDFCMPGRHADGLRLLQRIHQQWPLIAIVVLTQVGAPAVLEAIANTSGVLGLVSKFDAIHELSSAVQSAAKRKQYASRTIQQQLSSQERQYPTESSARLSPREAEVIRLFASGMSVSDIALLLNRSRKTISCQKEAAKRKLGIRSDRELFASVREDMLGL